MSENMRPVVQTTIIALGLLTVVGWGLYFMGVFAESEPTIDEWRTMLVEGDATERARAADALGELEDEQSMTALFAAMSDSEIQVRGRAGAAVQKILNADFYFRATASPESREAAIERIKAHWQAWQEKRKAGPKDSAAQMLAFTPVV